MRHRSGIGLQPFGSPERNCQVCAPWQRVRTAVRRTAAPRLRSQDVSNRAAFSLTGLKLRVGSIRRYP